MVKSEEYRGYILNVFKVSHDSVSDVFHCEYQDMKTQDKFDTGYHRHIHAALTEAWDAIDTNTKHIDQSAVSYRKF